LSQRRADAKRSLTPSLRVGKDFRSNVSSTSGFFFRISLHSYYEKIQSCRPLQLHRNINTKDQEHLEYPKTTITHKDPRSPVLSSQNLERRPLHQKELQPSANRSSFSTMVQLPPCCFLFLDTSVEKAWTPIQHTVRDLRSEKSRRHRLPPSRILIPHTRSTRRLRLPAGSPRSTLLMSPTPDDTNTGSLKPLSEAKCRLSVFVIFPVALFYSWCHVVHCCVHSFIDFTSILVYIQIAQYRSM
jgi:hypothetical protein